MYSTLAKEFRKKGTPHQRIQDVMHKSRTLDENWGWWVDRRFCDMPTLPTHPISIHVYTYVCIIYCIYTYIHVVYDMLWWAVQFTHRRLCSAYIRISEIVHVGASSVLYSLCVIFANKQLWTLTVIGRLLDSIYSLGLRTVVVVVHVHVCTCMYTNRVFVHVFVGWY